MKNMKNILLGAVLGIVVLGLFSYTDTKGNEQYVARINVPVKQRAITVVTSLEKANVLVSKGWVLQDVDLTFDYTTNIVGKYYTLILY